MARLGIKPVIVPETVKVEITKTEVAVSGPKGELRRDIPRLVSVEKKDGELMVLRRNDSKNAKAIQGTIRAHLVNMINGVTEGWSKSLELNGAGYRAEVKGNDLVLTVGYSHPVTIAAPGGVSFKVEKNLVTVEGSNKEDVGHTAALIRNTRKPNVYTGTGIKYQDEVIRRKAGKQAAKAE